MHLSSRIASIFALQKLCIAQHSQIASKTDIVAEDAAAADVVDLAETVAVAEALLPVVDAAALVVTAEAVVEVAAAVDEEEAAVVRLEDAELLAVEAVVVQVHVVERTSCLSSLYRRHLIMPQQGHCRAPSPRRCLRRTRKGGPARHQEPDPR